MKKRFNTKLNEKRVRRIIMLRNWLKWLSLAVGIVCLFGGFHENAIAECDHVWSQYGQTEYSYQYYNSLYHYVIEKIPVICSDCGHSDYIEPGPYFEEHSLGSNGRCMTCGSVTSTNCSHNRTELVYGGESTWSWRVYSTETQHQVSDYYKRVCVDCGYYLGNEDYNFRYENHYFYNNRECGGCGYPQPSECLHTNKKTAVIDIEYEKIPGDEVRHLEIFHEKTTCADCGHVITEDAERSFTDTHKFNNAGKCTVCGYQKASCAHTNTYKKYTTDAEYTNYDADQHYKIRYYNLICSKCSHVVQENVRGEELQKHSLDNLGACRYCTYSDIDKCKHWNTTEKVVERQSYRDINSTEHRVYGMGTKMCKDCGVVVEENTEVDEKELHTFDLEGICIYCERKITLYKEDEDIPSVGAQVFPKEGGAGDRKPQGLFISEWTVSTNVDWITLQVASGSAGDKCPYTVAENTSEVRTGYIIFDCGSAGKLYVAIIQEGETEVKNEIHPTLSGFAVMPTMVTLGDSITIKGTINGNGAKLTAVSVGVRNYSNQSLGGYWGHQATPNADTFDLSSFGSIVLSGDWGNTTFETGQWIVEVYATTEDGLGFEQSHSQIITISKPMSKHTFGTVTRAGDASVADKIVANGLEVPKSVLVSTTETEHTYSHPYFHECELCGYAEVFMMEVAETHAYNGGVCVCGAQEPECPHVNVLPTWDEEGRVVMSEDMITYTHHSVEIPYKMVCQDCGAATGETGYFAAETEEHDFSNGNVCICGYDRTVSCVHQYAVNKKEPVRNTGVYTRTSTHHTRVACDYVQYCTICGTQGPNLTVSESIKEAHWYLDDTYEYDGEMHWHKYLTCQGCGYIRERGHESHTYGEPTWNSYQYSDKHEHMCNGVVMCTKCGHLDNISACEPHSGDPCACGYSKDADAYVLVPQSSYYNARTATLQMDQERVEVLIYNSSKDTYQPIDEISHIDIEFEGENIRVEENRSIYFVRDDIEVAGYGTLTLFNILSGEVVDSIDVLGLTLYKEKKDWLFIPDFTTIYNSTTLITSDQAENNTKGNDSILLYEAPAITGEIQTGSDCTLKNYDQSGVHYDMPDKFPDGYYVVTFEVLNDTTMIWGVGARYSDGRLVDDNIQWIQAYSAGVGVISTNAKYIEGLIDRKGNVLDAISEVSKIEIKVPVGGYIEFFEADINVNMNAPEAKVFAVNTLDMILRVCSLVDVVGDYPDSDNFMALIDEKKFCEGFLELVDIGAIDPNEIMVTLCRDGTLKYGIEYLGNEQWWPLVQDLIKDCTYSVGDSAAQVVLAAKNPLLFLAEFGSDVAVKSTQWYEKMMIMHPEAEDPRQEKWCIKMIALPEQ